MTRSVNYLISGRSHLANLVVSLYTLRNHWQGRVYVHVWPESADIVYRISSDPRVKILAQYKEPEYRGKNEQFLHKIQVMQEAPTEYAMYLDADTTVHRPIDRIFERAEKTKGFVATQFNQWLTNGGVVKNRISKLIDREPINQQSVQHVLNFPFPSVNGGVFCCHRDSQVLPLWYEWAYAVKDIFIADETVLHALLAEFDSTGQIQVMKGGAWNCSPKHQPAGLSDDLITIRHYHGDSNLRPGKSQKGFDLWWPLYQEVREMNLGGINEWIDEVNNKHLRKLEKEQVNA